MSNGGAGAATIPCAVCGTQIDPATAGYSREGPACASCSSGDADARSKKLSPVAAASLALAVVPSAFGRSLTTWESPTGARREESTRMFFLTSTQVSEANMGAVPVTSDPAARRTHSDPVATFGGPAAMLVGALAIALAMRSGQRSSRSAIAGGVAVLLGAVALLRGLGKL